MQVLDVMTRSVKTIDGVTSVVQARDRMARYGIHHLVVRDTKGEVTGVFSSDDARSAPDRAMVADYMPHALHTFAPEMSIGAAAAFMRAHLLDAVPVIDRGRLVGIITINDLLAVLDRNSAALTR